MKKFKLNINNLDCANCAREIEEELNKNSKFKNVVVNFGTSKLSYQAEEEIPINEINKSNPNSIVQFGVHEATNRMTIKILDKESRKVIKEFPAEKTLDLIAKAWELAGIMVDEKR